MQELLIVNPSERGGEAHLYEANPRKGRKRASAKQAAWRREFARRYGGGKKRRANPAKRRKGKRRVARRSGATMASVKRGGRHVSRAAWKASGYRRNPRYRRNPVAMRATLQGITGMLIESAQGAVGALAIDAAMGQIVVRGWIPQTMLTTTTYPLTKGGIAIGLGLLANMLPLPAAVKRFAVTGVKGSLICTLRDALYPTVAGYTTLGRSVRPGARMGYPMPGRVMRGRVGEYLHGNGRSMVERESSMYGPGYVASNMGRYLDR